LDAVSERPQLFLICIRKSIILRLTSRNHPKANSQQLLAVQIRTFAFLEQQNLPSSRLQIKRRLAAGITASKVE
jgi:hypothetical protein